MDTNITISAFMENGCVVIVFPERLKHNEVKTFTDLIDNNITRGNFKFIIDAKVLEEIDPYGISALLKKTRDIRGSGGKLKIKNIKGQPLRIIMETGMDSVLNIEPSEELEQYRTPADYKAEFKTYILHEKLNAISIIHLAGTLYSPLGSQKLSDEMNKKIATNSKILLNFEKLKYLDSQTVNEILSVNHKLKNMNGQIAICNPGDIIMDMLEILNIATVIPVYGSISEGLQKLKRQD